MLTHIQTVEWLRGQLLQLLERGGIDKPTYEAIDNRLVAMQARFETER